MSGARKPKFHLGQVVFGTADDGGEYVRVNRVGPTQDLGMTEVKCFNPRWGGMEIYRAKDLRPLSTREIGPSAAGKRRRNK